MEDKHYTAKEGYTYKRIIDGFIMGNDMYLGKFIDGTDDVIENYMEVPESEDPTYEARKAEEKRMREMYISNIVNNF